MLSVTPPVYICSHEYYLVCQFVFCELLWIIMQHVTK